MNFDDFVRQMTLKYRVALAIAILKSKPDQVSLYQHINRLKEKMDDTAMNCDSDITVCSEDFLMDENGGHETVDGADASANILEGFDLAEFDSGDVGDCAVEQVRGIEGVAAEVDNKVACDVPTQSTFCESVQNPNLLESQSIQSSLTFYQSDTVTNNQARPIANVECANEGSRSGDRRDPEERLLARDVYDSQKTELYSLHGFFNSNTHFSPSQTAFWDIVNKHLYSTRSKDTSCSHDITEKDSVRKAVKDDDPMTTQKDYRSVDLNKVNTEIILSKPLNDEDTTYKNTTETFDAAQTHENINIDDTRILSYELSLNEIATEKDNTKYIAKAANPSNETLNYHDKRQGPNENQLEMSTIKVDLDGNLGGAEEENSQAELIPFKVIEELNRIKGHLNRKERAVDGYVTDSGYKSDSQSRGSHKGSFQASDAWVNQSAHCLLEFIVDSPVVLRTSEITNDISWNKEAASAVALMGRLIGECHGLTEDRREYEVLYFAFRLNLGRLIDRLHEEEKYPPFLEKVLEAVEELLTDLYGGDSFVGDVGQEWWKGQAAASAVAGMGRLVRILRKDEKIHRLFYLNRSHHILKYTLDKITQLLESFHSRIEEDCALEMTDTDKTENLCYILHILEHILRRHASTKDLLSQASTQTSQEDKSLKRSSITEVWRRKWNPNYNSDKEQTTSSKKCVEAKCSEILNKIIVRAMDGYSLVSFAALQCFNLLQS